MSKPESIFLLLGLLLSGCVIGRLDDDKLRIIPITEVHRMDDKGFPINLFQPKQERLYVTPPKLNATNAE